MSDPPRKVGSLRDRIAAFENKGAAPAPAPPPPRPKPGHVAWQPKPASPTSPRPPPSADNDDGAERKPGAGMSAADAQQSIGKLSLKERMAALQGSTAFGGPAGSAGGPPPRPAGEKPKWKPPPVVQRAEPIGGEDEEEAAKPAVSPPATVDHAESAEPARSPVDEAEKKEEAGEGGEAKEDGEQPDPEDEERQRRAALAARMARLGGARVGMGPPIFGKKPDVPPKRLSKSEEKPKEEDVPKEEKPTEVSPHSETVPEGLTVEEPAAVASPPPVAETKTESSTDIIPERKDSDSDPSSLLSPESSAAPTPVRSPHMPVPQAPKRAAPPRKRPAKSPSPAPPVLGGGIQESPAPLVSNDVTLAKELLEERGDRQPEVTEGQIEDIVKAVVPDALEPPKAAEVEELVVASEPEPVTEPHEIGHNAESSVAVAAEEPAAEEHTPKPVVEEPQPEASSVVEPEPQMEDVHEAQPELHHEEEPAPVPVPAEPAEEPEEDEAARRKRIAERLAKSGGFNPFAGGMPPPVRRESSDSARSPPLPPRRDSLQEAISPKPSLPERKASVGSVEGTVPARKSSLDVGAFTPEEPHIPEPSAPAPHLPTRELQEEPIEEGYEDEEVAAEPRAAHHGGYDDHEEDVAAGRESEKYEDIYEHEDPHAHEIAEEPENLEEVSEPALPPPPPRTTRPPPAIPQAPPAEAEEELRFPSPPRRDFPPPPPRRVSVPPPPPPPAPVEFEEEEVPDHVDEAEAYARHAQDIGSEDEAELHEHLHDEYDEPEEEEYEPVEEVPAPPPPPRHAAVPPPPPPPAETFFEDDEEDDEPPPPPPPRVPSRGNSLNVPPPLAPRPPPLAPREDEYDQPEEDEEEEVEDDEPTPPPPPPRSARPVSRVPIPPPVSATGKPVLPPLQHPSAEEETLEDIDGDPIDPRFYSPQRSSGSQHVTSPQSMTFPLASPPLPPARIVSPPPMSPPPPPPPQRIVSPPPPPERAISPPAIPSSPPPPPPPITAPRPPVGPAASEPQEEQAEDEEDPEQARRRTIAERMAKLGGIRFGAPPPIPSARRAPPLEPEPEHEETEEKPAEAEEAPQEEEEEDEFARKQRIAARIAGMGGMRFGMMPGMAPPKPPSRVQQDEEEDESTKAPPPPKRSAPVVPPPPPPPPAAEEDHGSESDYQHVSDSDHIEHEESELEEVTHEDAEEEAPPVPDRFGRRASVGPPPVPQARAFSPPAFASAPPVPRTRPPAPAAFTYPPPPHVPHPLPTTTDTPGGFVVVDQPQSDEPPPPPPPRAAHPPARAPPRAPPAAPEAASQWETPSIPNIDFGGETDLSLSGQWSEDSTNYPPAPPPAPPPVSQAQTEHPLPATSSRPPPSEHNFSAEELQAQWGRVGVQVHETAAMLFDKSKKSVIGDGTYRGFVATVISAVPNAAKPTAALDSYGHLVYSQVGGAVQRRASDIMPGDVVVVSEAKFKGHKGLQSYSQTVGVGEPLVGVIGDFELKKSKVKVFQANQHVGHQSVESVSYRLEDLKSGEVKIYRVLEA